MVSYVLAVRVFTHGHVVLGGYYLWRQGSHRRMLNVLAQSDQRVGRGWEI